MACRIFTSTAIDDSIITPIDSSPAVPFIWWYKRVFPWKGLQMNHNDDVLNRIHSFISIVIKHEKPIYPKIPIHNKYDEITFADVDLIMALVNFERE